MEFPARIPERVAFRSLQRDLPTPGWNPGLPVAGGACQLTQGKPSHAGASEIFHPGMLQPGLLEHRRFFTTEVMRKPPYIPTYTDKCCVYMYTLHTQFYLSVILIRLPGANAWSFRAWGQCWSHRKGLKAYWSWSQMAGDLPALKGLAPWRRRMPREGSAAGPRKMDRISDSEELCLKLMVNSRLHCSLNLRSLFICVCYSRNTD